MGVNIIPKRDTNGNVIQYVSPFASKVLPEGSLFKRVHGVSVSIPANTTGTIELIVPYNLAKFNGAEIMNTGLGDTVNFKVYDNASGTISTVPNLMLNQFGFNVQMPGGPISESKGGFYKNTSEYDADIILGMKIECEYYNASSEAKTIAMNVELHEVKP